MKTAEVRILPATALEDLETEDSFLLVETTFSSEGEETNIDHVHRSSDDSDSISKDTVATSLKSKHKTAIEWAATFAALNEIPVVYERRKAG